MSEKLFQIGGAVCEAPEECRCGKAATVLIPHRAADPRGNWIEGLCAEHAAERRAYREWADRNPVVANEVMLLEISASEMDGWPAYSGGKEAAEKNRARAAELRAQHGCPE